ncbi:vWA domain-containing protein [Tropicimonas sp. S265A]|uniref:vWA domain-containing protein n=1 Tax=Tropicimonas sp. S265A TaxID=3415134 RepID=UPI003C7A983B
MEKILTRGGVWHSITGAVFTLLAALFLLPTAGHAAGTVSWTNPANNSSFPVGTVISPQGIASGGISSGSGLDLVIVLDGSGSMNNTTLAQQAAAANALIAAVPQATSQIGIVQFGSSASTIAPLQSAANQGVLMAAVNSVDDNLGTTDTAEAIDLAASLLTANDNGNSKQIVLITDGGPNSQTAAETAAANAAGGTPAVQVNTVGLPNTNFGSQDDIAAAGGGIFVTASNQQALVDLFTGTGGNLVGIDQIDVELPDGTLLSDVALTSGLGNFDVTQGYALEAGANTWTVTAFFTNGQSAMADLTVFGKTGSTNVVPLPAGVWMLLAGLGGLGALRRRS